MVKTISIRSRLIKNTRRMTPELTFYLPVGAATKTWPHLDQYDRKGLTPGLDLVVKYSLVSEPRTNCDIQILNPLDNIVTIADCYDERDEFLSISIDEYLSDH